MLQAAAAYLVDLLVKHDERLRARPDPPDPTLPPVLQPGLPGRPAAGATRPQPMGLPYDAAPVAVSSAGPGHGVPAHGTAAGESKDYPSKGFAGPAEGAQPGEGAWAAHGAQGGYGMGYAAADEPPPPSRAGSGGWFRRRRQ